MADRSPSTSTSHWQQALGDARLLVSGFGRWGGGLYDITRGAPVALDDLPTSGFGVGGDQLWRVLRAPAEQTALCELLAYDDRGLRTYQRLDPVRDPHDVCWHDGAVHITSSWDSIVWRLDPDGMLRRAWWGSTVPDAWHLNSLTVVDGRLHASAFGRFDRYKAWRSEVGRTSGFVVDITTGEDVLTGLAHPHNPIWAGDRWYVCESIRGTLTECAPDGRILRRAKVRRFARGLALVGELAFVGGNAHRDQEEDRADVAVVDLDSFRVVERIPLPCLEIYDIRPVPDQLARAVAVGFGNNPARAVEQKRATDRTELRRSTSAPARIQLVTPRTARKLARAGDVLSREQSSRCGVEGSLPQEAVAGEVLVLDVTVRNQSDLSLATVPPHPIRVGARWFANGLHVRNPLTALPALLHPGESTRVEIVLEAPQVEGEYQVRVALHQAGVGWFGLRLEDTITVVAGHDYHLSAGRRHPQPQVVGE